MDLVERESVKCEVVAIGESDQKKNLIRSKMWTLRKSKYTLVSWKEGKGKRMFENKRKLL